MKLLVVDDNPDSLDVLTDMLVHYLPGCEVTTASSGQQGIEVARTLQPDTILLDILMPGMDGFEACRLLKGAPATRHIPVVFLTGESGDSASRIRGLEIGGDAFLTKPVLAGELIAEVRAMLRIKQAEDVLRGEKYALERLVAERAAALAESEGRFRILFEQTPVGYQSLDGNGRVLEVNATWLGLLGYARDERDEVVGRWFGDFLAPGSVDHFTATFQKFKAAGEISGMELLMVRKEGATVLVSFTGKIGRDEHGNFKQTHCVLTDITERKRVEEALRESELQYRTLGEAIPYGVWTTDTAGYCTYASESFLELVNMTMEQLQDLGWLHLLSPEDVEPTKEHWLHCVQTGEDFEREHRFRTEDGSYRDVLAIGRPIRERTGKIVKWVGLNLDITERKRAEERLEESHNLLVNLARLVPSVIYQYRLYPDGRSAFPYASPGMNDIYEVTPEQVRQDATLVFGRLHPEDYDHVANAILESARTLATFHCEFRVILPRQGLRWRWSQAHPERTEDGGTLWHGIISDITERKRAEEEKARLAVALQASEERFRSLVEHAMVGVYRTTPDGRILFANPALVRMLGYPSFEEMTRQLDLERAAGEGSFDRASFIAAMERDGHVVGLELLWTRADGNQVWVRENACEIRNPEGEVECYEGTVEDLTRVKAEEARLLHATRMEAVDRLAGSIAHDFNNLLQAMLAGLALVKSDGPDQDRLGELEDLARRGGALARQLLLFTRQEIGCAEPLDLNQVVGDTVDLVRRLLPGSVALALELDPGELLVNIDRGQLEQVLLNLAGNAVDAMADGGRLVLRSGGAGDNEVWLEVEDSGCGMPEDVRARLFEPFFTTKQFGSGLGLAVVHGVVGQHHGRVEVDSELGRGSRFRVTLPRGADLGRRPEAHLAPVAVPARGRGERVLVVEDEASVRVALEATLSKLGYQVVVVDSGEAALALPADEPFAILLTDMMLGGITGAEVAAGLSQRWPDLEVVIMSGYAENAIIRRGVVEGRVNFLAKPFDMDILARELARALAGHQSSAD